MSTAAAFEPKRRKPRRPHQPRRTSHAFAEFERGTFMYLRGVGAAILWNSSAAMRRNGYRPSGVAAYLHREFGVERYKTSAASDSVSPEALEFFEKLVIPMGVQAPSLLRDEPWGRA